MVLSPDESARPRIVIAALRKGWPCR